MKVRFVSTLCLAFPLVAVHFGGCGSNSGSSTFDPNNPNGDLGLTTGSGDMTGGLTGGTITSGTGMGTGSGTGSGGNPLDPDAACAAQAQDTRAIPVDIFIMLDKSGSMDCPASDDDCERLPNGATPVHPTRWDAVTPPSPRSSTRRPVQAPELASASSASATMFAE